MKWEDKIEFAGHTDVGMRRANNQDYHVTLPASTFEHWRKRGHLFLVADGMGAHAVGELASKMAATSIAHTYQKLPDSDARDAIRKAFIETNTSINNRGRANRDFHGMGTTSTALLLLPDGAVIAHVGDSRAYRVRDGSIDQLSFDHSLAWELVRKRQMTLEQARDYVPSNVITRSIGPEAEVEVDVEGPHEVLPGDVFVLCSDGLSGPVADFEIGVIARHLPPEQVCQRLIDLANLRGGPDNITVVVVRIGQPTEHGPSPDSSRRWNTERVLTSMMFGGAGLCVLGLAGSFAGWHWMKWNTLVPALASIGVGLLGAAAARLRSWLRTPPETQAKPACVGYQHAVCTADATTISLFADRINLLRTTAVDQAWTVDWSQFFMHRQEADRLQKSGDNEAVVRELCNAFALLAVAQRKRFQENSELLRGK